MVVIPPLLPILAKFAPAQSQLKDRLEGLGYVLCDLSEDQTVAFPDTAGAPQVALIPISAETVLEELIERVEVFQFRCPDIEVLGVGVGKMPFKSTDLFRAGLSGFFSLPFEEEALITKLFQASPVETRGKDLSFDQLMRVNVVEIEKAETLPFDVYLFLPMNQKVILYVEKERRIDERIIKKFREKSHYNLYIRRADVQRYLKFTSDILVNAPGDGELSQIERGRQVSKRLVGLMGGFFTDASMSEGESHDMLENLKSVLNELEDSSGSKKDAAKAVTQFASRQMTHFHHAQNVAAYCGLFGMSVGIMEPETLRMGGLLHDLGLSDLPETLIGRELEEMDEDDAAKYKLHPGGGKYTIEERGLKVPQAALDMVLYHHERPDGSGYPYGKKADEIPPYAKVCMLADEFDKLTSIRPGKRQLSPVDAMRRIAGLDGQPPHPLFEPDFHQPIVDAFLGQAQAEAEVVVVEAEASAEAEVVVIETETHHDLRVPSIASGAAPRVGKVQVKDATPAAPPKKQGA